MDKFKQLQDKLWEYAEPGMREYKSAGAYAEFLKNEGISFENRRVQVNDKSELPEICILSLQTPRCWHWSLYYKGVFYDPEHRVLEDFPKAKRKYYWKINE